MKKCSKTRKNDAKKASVCSSATSVREGTMKDTPVNMQVYHGGNGMVGSLDSTQSRRDLSFVENKLQVDEPTCHVEERNICLDCFVPRKDGKDYPTPRNDEDKSIFSGKHAIITNLRKIILSAIILICLCGLLVAQTIPAVEPSNWGTPNAGTVENPYLINTPGNLVWVSLNRTQYRQGISATTLVHFKQTADIDMDGITFQPIPFFTGIYDGGKYEIQNLSVVVQSNTGRAGLFATVYNNSIVKNVSLVNPSIGVSYNGPAHTTTYEPIYAGGIVAYLENARIINSSVTTTAAEDGSIYVYYRHTTTSNQRPYAGGIAAYMVNNAVVLNCFSDIEVFNIIDSAASGASVILYTGGITGYLDDSIISNSYSLKAVEGRGNGYGQIRTGGIVGAFHNDSVVDACYTISPLTSSGGSANSRNGLIAYIQNTASTAGIVRNIWSTDGTGLTNSIYMNGNVNLPNNKGITSANMRAISEYTIPPYNWDFNFTWNINPTINSGFPYLRMLTEDISINDQPPIDPLAPLFVRVRPANQGGVLIEWDKPMTSEPDAYIVYRNGTAVTAEEPAFVLNKDARQWIDYATIPDNATAHYQVAAFYQYTVQNERVSGYEMGARIYNGVEVSNTTSFTNRASANFLFASSSIENTTSLSATVGFESSLSMNMAQNNSLTYTSGPFIHISRFVSYTNSLYNPPRNLASISTLGSTWSQITINWQAPLPGSASAITNYRVFRDGQRIDNLEVHQALVTSTTFTDNVYNSGQISGNKYNYYVVAVYENGETSQPSNTIEVTPIAGIRPPTLLGYYSNAGTVTNPYLISTYQHLLWMSEAGIVKDTSDSFDQFGWYHNSSTPVHFRQMNDIDAFESQFANNGYGFRPIGHSESPTKNVFVGVYDGQGYKISNLHIYAESRGFTPVGLFSMVASRDNLQAADQSVIKNLILENVNIEGSAIVGGIVGELSEGATIENCAVINGSILGYSSVGGIAGLVRNGAKIQTSFTDGLTLYGNTAGGITGTLTSSHIENCYSNVNIHAGYNGGIAGVAVNSNIKNTYSLGNNTDFGTGLGGRIGGYTLKMVDPDNLDLNNISNNFWDNQRLGTTENFGFISIAPTNSVGKTTAEMKNAATFTAAGWDFTSIWEICNGHNNGYPYFKKWHDQHTFYPPRLLSYTLDALDHPNLSWTEPLPGSCGTLSAYKIFRNNIEIDLVGSVYLSYIDTSILPPGETYYNVQAVYVNMDGVSDFSNTVTISNYPAVVLDNAIVSNCAVALVWYNPSAGRGGDNDVEEIREWFEERDSDSSLRGTKQSKSESTLLQVDSTQAQNDRRIPHFDTMVSQDANAAPGTRALTTLRVERKLGAAGNWTIIAADLHWSTYYYIDECEHMSVSHPSCGNTYFYRVVSVYTSPDEKSTSNEVTAVMPTEHKFNHALNLNHSLDNTGRVVLSWDPPAPGSCGSLSYYQVRRESNNIGTTSSTSFTITNPQLGMNSFNVIPYYTNHNGAAITYLSYNVLVTPIYSINSDTHEFGDALVSSNSTPQSFTISNTGTFDLVVESIVKTGANQTDFTTLFANLPWTISPGGSRNFSVTFSPQTFGLKVAELQIFTNAIDLQGGVYSILLSGNAIQPLLALSEDEHNFASVIVNQSSMPQTFTLTNNGNSMMTLQSINLVGVDTEDFVISTPSILSFPVNLLPNEHRTINATFHPLSMGDKAATLLISHNGFGSVYEVLLSGYGIDGKFLIDNESFDFGSQIVGTISDWQTFTITNTGNMQLTINSITGFDTDDFELSLIGLPTLPYSIDPDDEFTFEIRFSPTSVGQKTDFINIIHSASSSPSFITVAGTGLAPIFSIDKTELDFGDVLYGLTSDSQTITITNTGTSPLTIISTMRDGDSSSFTLTSSSGTIPAILDAGDEYTFEVTFTPSSAEEKSSLLTIYHDAEEAAHTVALTGRGVRPIMTIDPEYFGFGDIVLGQTSDAQSFNIYNTGTSVLTINSIGLMGLNYEEFILSTEGLPSVPFDIAPGEYETIHVSFAPTSVDFKMAAVQINIYTNIELWGTGVQSTISFSQTAVDFDGIPVGSTSDWSFITIRNTGTAPLTISEIFVNLSADFIVDGIEDTPIILDPNDLMSISVAFAPVTPGPKNGVIILTSNVEDSPHLVTFEGVGVGFPILSLNQDVHDFGNVHVAEISDFQTFTITNTGSAPLIITAISDCQSDDFVAEGLNEFPTELAPNESASFRVAFAPLTAGEKTDEIIITHNAAGTSTSISLSGNGVEPEFSITPTSHHFGDILLGQSSNVQIFTITNTGTSTLDINSIIVAGTNQSEFSVNVANLPWNIAPNGTRSFTASFTPTTIGSKVANIVINDDPIRTERTTRAFHFIELTGNGVTPIFHIDIESYDFGSIVIGETSDTQTFTISNMGTGDLSINNIIKSGQNQNEFTLIVNDLPWTLTAGDTQTFTVTFFPTTIGSKTANINIFDENNSMLQILPLSGICLGLPVFYADLESHDFGNVIVAEISDFQTFTITNTGGSTLIVYDVSDCETEEFVSEQINLFPMELGPEESVSFTVAFAPQTEGFKSDQIIITHSADDSPFIVELSGLALGLPIFTIDPESHDFGTLIVAEISYFQTFTITNTGGSPLIITDVSDGETEDFVTEQINQFPTELGPEESVSFTVAFTPQTVGLKTDQIIITHSVDDAPFIVNLTGIAENPIFNPPQSLEAIAGDARVNLFWEAPEEQEIGTLIGYKIYRDNGEISQSEIGTTEYVDTDVVNNVEYNYYITAIYADPDGESEPSNIATATPQIVSETDHIIDLKTELIGNYPNPFNPTTTIKFSLAVASNLHVDIYNVKGQKDKRL